MGALTVGHIVGIVITLLLITGIGIYSGSKVKTAADFSISGRKASSIVVAGTIMGTLVGGGFYYRYCAASLSIRPLCVVVYFRSWHCLSSIGLRIGAPLA